MKRKNEGKRQTTANHQEKKPTANRGGGGKGADDKNPKAKGQHNWAKMVKKEQKKGGRGNPHRKGVGGGEKSACSANEKRGVRQGEPKPEGNAGKPSPGEAS